MAVMSGCASNNFVTPKDQIDDTLPVVNGIKTISASNEIGLEWPSFDDNDKILGYYIYREDLSNGVKKVMSVNDRFATHFVDTSLTPATQYKYSVKAYSSNGVSKDGMFAMASTTKTLESVPFAKAIALPQRVKLIWRPHPDLRVSSYIIQRSSAGSNSWSEIDEIKGRLNAEYIDKVSNPNAYNYRILVKTSDGQISSPSQSLSVSQ